MFFSADERQLWKTDGTPEGTVRLANVSEAKHFRSFGETLYFQGEIKHNEPRLWKSDGTVGGTHVIGLSDRSSDHQDAWVLSGNTDKVFLWSADRDSPGLWTTSHAADGRQLLNAAISGPSSGSRIGGLARIDGSLFRRNGDELWRIVEGEQPARMELVSPEHPVNDSVDEALAAQHNRHRAEIGDLHFSISDGDLWVYDSKKDVLRSVTDQTPIGGGCGYKPTIVVMGDFVFFDARDEMGNRGLWKSDGTAEGTMLVAASAHATYPISAGDGVVYFMNTEAATGKELWKTDGTQEGTMLVADLHAGPESSRKYSGGTAAEIDGHLYFGGYDGFHGHELWKIPLETKVTPSPGDANRDGLFNSRDLIQVFQRGVYEDQVLGNSTWEDGDWNSDGDFTSADLVLAFQSGLYEQSLGNAIPADVRPFQFADEQDRMKDMLEDGDFAEQFDLTNRL